MLIPKEFPAIVSFTSVKNIVKFPANQKILRQHFRKAMINPCLIDGSHL